MAIIARTTGFHAVSLAVHAQIDNTVAGPVYGRNGIRHIGGLILDEAIIRNVGTFGADVMKLRTREVRRDSLIGKPLFAVAPVNPSRQPQDFPATSCLSPG
jgi:hypothetical protein